MPPTPRSSQQLQKWLDYWWKTAENELNTSMPKPTLIVDASNSLAHFKTARGFAFAEPGDEGDSGEIVVAKKLLQQADDRILGILLHEIGHAIDFALVPTGINNWATRRGRQLAQTPERRADDIVWAVFSAVIRYDADNVQTTEAGVSPRPEELGL